MANIAKKVVEANSITFEWADDTTTLVDLDAFTPELIARAAIHGLSQKLGDSYSGAAGNILNAKAMFDDTLASLIAGDWNRAGGGFSTGGIWVEALAQAADATIEEALEKWNAMDDAERAAIRKLPAVKLAKAEIELARAKAKAEDAPAITL